MRVCDWIASRLHDIGVRNVYGLMGGGASGLNDGFIKHGGISYICFHHEQGAGHAATAESKVTGRLSVVNPTTGCGGTNCITSVLNAWQDGVPVLFISGNVRTDHCSRHINSAQGIRIRKFGIQEHDIIETVRSMTKHAAFVEFPHRVADELEKAIREALTGRPGPVWLDIPADVQVSQMPRWLVTNPDLTDENGYPLLSLPRITEGYDASEHWFAQRATAALAGAKRPIILAGQGIKQSGTLEDFRWFIERSRVPYVSTYGARDLMPYDHPLNIGAIGIKGSRAGNFAMQACDTILVLGSSVNASHTGYDPRQWTPLAKTRMVIDIDGDEMLKGTTRWDLAVKGDLRGFFNAARSIANDQR